MGQKAEENDGKTIAENLMENIWSEVTRSINERTDSCFDSFESLKLQTFGSEDILDYGWSKRENCGKGKESECQDGVNTDFQANDLSYPSLANFPEVCVHSSSLSKTSKQGEGDFQHPTIREAVTFYRLERGEEETRPSGSKDCGGYCGSAVLVEHLHEDADKCDVVQAKSSLETEEAGKSTNEGKEWNTSCDSSMITETSYEELIEDLQRKINNVSFDSIHLSDSEDGSEAPGRSADTDIPFKCCSRKREDCVCLSDNQDGLQEDIKDSYDCSGKLNCLQQSKKFCQINSIHIFPHSDVPSSYCQLVDDSCDKYDSITQEDDEQILLSDGSSEELVIIERDEIDQITADNRYLQANSRRNSFYCQMGQPNTLLSQYPSCSSGQNYKSVEQSDKDDMITVVADVEPTTDYRNWEEAAEVQLNVTEPMKLSETDDDDEDCDFVKSRKFWTSIGLVTEKSVNPKYLTFISDDTDGIESVPGMVRVRESRLPRDLQDDNEILKVDEFLERQTSDKMNRNLGGYVQDTFDKPPNEDHNKACNRNYCTKLDHDGENLSDDKKVNYLNFSAEEKNGKKKKKLVSRITKSFTNLFRSRKKNSK